jgi:hypothetical protein
MEKAKEASVRKCISGIRSKGVLNSSESCAADGTLVLAHHLALACADCTDILKKRACQMQLTASRTHGHPRNPIVEMAMTKTSF